MSELRDQHRAFAEWFLQQNPVAPNAEDLAWAAWKAALAQHVEEAIAREREACADAARQWEDDYVIEDSAPRHVDAAIRSRADHEVTK